MLTCSQTGLVLGSLQLLYSRTVSGSLLSQDAVGHTQSQWFCLGMKIRSSCWRPYGCVCIYTPGLHVTTTPMPINRHDVALCYLRPQCGAAVVVETSGMKIAFEEQNLSGMTRWTTWFCSCKSLGSYPKTNSLGCQDTERCSATNRREARPPSLRPASHLHHSALLWRCDQSWRETPPPRPQITEFSEQHSRT